MMTKSISGTVGRNGVNRPDDVRVVQELLLRIPENYGGGEPMSVVPNGRYDWVFEQAITRFQQQALNPLTLRDPNGQVVPGSTTWQKLIELAGRGFAAAPDPLLALAGLREDIVRIAIGEIGRVHDFQGMTFIKDGAVDESSRRERHGRQRLKEYFDVAMEQPPNWSYKGKYTQVGYNSSPVSKETIDKRTATLTWEEGIRYAGLRPPAGGQVPAGNNIAGAWNGVHWCGIFATWVLRQAGLNVRWGSLPRQGKDGFWRQSGGWNGIKNWPSDPNVAETIAAGGRKDPKKPWTVRHGFILLDTDPFTRENNIQPGDVVVIAKNSHHFIIEDVSTGSLKVIEGNSDGQSIKRAVYPISDVRGLYRTSPAYY